MKQLTKKYLKRIVLICLIFFQVGGSLTEVSAQNINQDEESELTIGFGKEVTTSSSTTESDNTVSNKPFYDSKTEVLPKTGELLSSLMLLSIGLLILLLVLMLVILRKLLLFKKEKEEEN